MPVERLSEERLAALEDRVEADLAAGRHGPLVAELETLVDRHPLRERLRGQLMLALYRAGRQTTALERYLDGRRHLVDELGLEPGPELRALQAAILRQDPELGRTPSGGPGRSRSRSLRLRALLGAAVAAGAGVALAASVAHKPRAVRVEGNAVAVVDAGEARISATQPLRSRPGAAAAGAGSVWLTMPSDGTVARYDPATGSVGQTIRVGSGASGVAVGGGAVWVAHHLDGSVSRIDPRADRVVQTIRVGGGPGPIAASRRSVWVGEVTGSRAIRLSPVSGEVRGSVHLDTRPEALAVSAGAVWVASDAAGRVLRLDPISGRVLAAVPVGRGPVAIAVARDSVWATKLCHESSLRSTLTRVGGEVPWRVLIDGAQTAQLPVATQGTSTECWEALVSYWPAARASALGALPAPADTPEHDQ